MIGAAGAKARNIDRIFSFLGGSAATAGTKILQ